MRTKSLCLNPSLERQPGLLRCFHSAFGKDTTRGNNSRKVTDGLSTAGRRGLPLRWLPGGRRSPLTSPWHVRGRQWSVGQSRPSDLAAMPAWAPPLGVGQSVLHRACLQSQGDKTFVRNPGKRKGYGLRRLLGDGPHRGAPEHRSLESEAPVERDPQLPDSEGAT